jgi:hypothetical protein
MEILKILKKIKKIPGPILILIKIDKGNSIGDRISRTPKNIKEEFMKNI